MTQEEIKQVVEEGKTKIFHKIKGKGVIDSYRTDKLANNRLKAKINFVIPDLLEEVIKPEFIYLDDDNLSLDNE